jgi:spermidine synthase
MIPWELIDTAKVPTGEDELRLYKRGDEFSIRVNTCELMNSRAHGSEEVLAESACNMIAGRPEPAILIGGLGMGFTAAAALRHLPEGGRVVFAEIVPAVVSWNRGPLADLAGRPLDDPRIHIMETDVANILQHEKHIWDAILLDVDNGPAGLTRKGNNRLYTPDGLKTAFMALKPSGVLGVWSADPSPPFTQRLKKTGFDVREIRARARSVGKGSHHTIWLAVRSNAIDSVRKNR